MFADYGAEWINGLEVMPNRSGVTSSTAIEMGTFDDTGPVSFRMGPEESLYIVMYSQGSVY
jgi:hypothetical protein